MTDHRLTAPLPSGPRSSTPLDPVDESWIRALPDPVRAAVVAFADPHPPGARARAQLAAEALTALVAGWPVESTGLDDAVRDLVAHLTTVGQTTLHQPGVTNMIEAVLAGGLAGEPTAVAARMRARYEAITATMAVASDTMATTGGALLSDGDRILVHDFADRSTQAVVRQAATDGKRLTVTTRSWSPMRVSAGRSPRWTSACA